MIKAIMNDSKEWCLCGNCRHKLFHVKQWWQGPGVIEIKCHSCKVINEVSL